MQSDSLQRWLDALSPEQCGLLVRLGAVPGPLRVPGDLLTPAVGALVVQVPDQRVTLSPFGWVVRSLLLADLVVA